jgi:hypothetical protein
VRDAELAVDGGCGAVVEHVHVHVGFIAVGRQEPGLHRTVAADALDSPAALGQPDVAQPTTEEAPLALVLGSDTQCAETLIHEIGVDAFAVVGTNELVAPAAQRGHAEAAYACFPSLQKSGVGRSNPKLDPAALTAGSSDRRVGIGHELGDDLREVDPRLREVLTK